MSGAIRAQLENLTIRERQVLKLLLNGHSSADIAECLSISLRTIEKYRSSIGAKLEISMEDCPLECLDSVTAKLE